MRLFTEALLIILTFAFVFVWQNTLLSTYTLPLLGLIIFLYMILSVKARKLTFLESGGTKSVLLLNIAILLFIFSTGGLHSPLYFLLYFVLFGIAFVFHPVVVFVYTLSATALFVPQIIQGDLQNNLFQMGSLYLITPLAFFFGKEYLTRMREEDTTTEKAEMIQENIEEALQDENLAPQTKELLKEAKVEAEELTK